MHWGLLRREVFIGIWIIVSLALSLFLFGVIHLPHDEKNKISWVRKFCGVLVLFFTIYLLPGITNTQYARLQLLSGFPPPLNYSIYPNSHKGLEPNVRNDYDKALQLAAQQHKPILIDFTGWACVNCRKMEENVWAQPEVHQYIQNNFILVSLYVDDRAKLPPAERITYTAKDGTEKNIETHGDKWATFEEENFSQASQPLYAIVNSRQQLLNNPVGYTPNAQEYLSWLQCGKRTFDANKIKIPALFAGTWFGVILL